MKRTRWRLSFGPNIRRFRSYPPAHANMEIRDVEYYDAESGAPHLTDEAVEEGRDWVSYLQL